MYFATGRTASLMGGAGLGAPLVAAGLAAMRSGGTGRLPHDAAPAFDDSFERASRTAVRAGAAAASIPTGPLGSIDARRSPHRRRQRRAFALLRALDAARLYHAVRGAHRLLVERRQHVEGGRPGETLRGIGACDLTSLLEELRPLALGLEDRRLLRKMIARDQTMCNVLARSLVVAGYTFRGDPLIASLWGDLPPVDEGQIVAGALGNRRIRLLLEPFGLDGAVRRSLVPFWFVDSVQGEFLYNARRRTYEASAMMGAVPFKISLSIMPGSGEILLSGKADLLPGQRPSVSVNGVRLNLWDAGERLFAGSFPHDRVSSLSLHVFGPEERGGRVRMAVAMLHRGRLTTRP